MRNQYQESQAPKPFFIRFTKREFSGGMVSDVYRFEHEDNRDIVLAGMYKSPCYTEIHAGRVST